MKQRKPKQLSFFPKESLSFGGSLLKGANARVPRPLKSKEFVHIVLKSDVAVGDLRLTTQKSKVEKIVREKVETFGVQIHSLAIASNHIHILIKFKHRFLYFNWIRRVTGLIARLMLKAERGSPSKKKFWTYRPFTRIVFWGKDFRGVLAYIEKNILEAIGFIDYMPRTYKVPSSA